MSRKPNYKLSKWMSYVLRHKGPSMGIPFTKDGYCTVANLVSHSAFPISMEDIQGVVSTDKKQRYLLTTRDGTPHIRAQQGHSFPVNVDHTPITLGDLGTLVPEWVVHGTYSRHLPSIMQNGLSTMTRLHVHFAQKAEGALSGMRQNVTVRLWVSLRRSIEQGVEWMVSGNGVVLTAGVDGVLPASHILKVEEYKQGVWKTVE
eukprot:gnl/Dysnectes_brevis/1482_a1676_1733.p1 GENE.gnl/Dysnectes_brevis/1482_a1676_1733~~gnl/Dysnectes_brevis/1482_a1676_1733.p1  ORF type:complete len:203 (-),score=61.78 gnl/Dysnectes_brevis/1482_a1676_1733:168-776(-)